MRDGKRKDPRPVNRKSYALYAAIEPQDIIIMRSRVKDAKDSLGGVLPKMQCTYANLVMRAKWTCICGGNVKSVG